MHRHPPFTGSSGARPLPAMALTSLRQTTRYTTTRLCLIPLKTGLVLSGERFKYQPRPTPSGRSAAAAEARAVRAPGTRHPGPRRASRGHWGEPNPLPGGRGKAGRRRRSHVVPGAPPAVTSPHGPSATPESPDGEGGGGARTPRPEEFQPPPPMAPRRGRGATEKEKPLPQTVLSLLPTLSIPPVASRCSPLKTMAAEAPITAKKEAYSGVVLVDMAARAGPRRR